MAAFSLILVLLIPILIGAWLIHLGWACGPAGRVTAISLATVTALLIYRAFYPSGSFYLDELDRGAGISLDSDIVVLASDLSAPTLQGDYVACAILRPGKAELAQSLKGRKIVWADSGPRMGSDCLSDNPLWQQRRAPLGIVEKYDVDYVFEWGLLGDETTLYFQTVQW